MKTLYYLEANIDGETIVLCKPKKSSKISQSRRYRQEKNNIDSGLRLFTTTSDRVIESEQKALYDYCGIMFDIKSFEE